MLHYLWVGAALGAVVLLARQGLRSAAANVRYLIAVGSLLLLSVVPAAIAVVVMQNLAPAAPSIPLPVDSVGQPEAMRLEEMRPTMAAGTPAPATAVNLPVQVPEGRGSERLLAAMDLAAMCLPWLWVFGAPLSFALTNRRTARAERLRRQSRRWKTPELRKCAGSWRFRSEYRTAWAWPSVDRICRADPGGCASSA